MNPAEIQQKITDLESLMYDPEFWNDKIRAQQVLAEIEDLKAKLSGAGKYDIGNCILSIFTGAGGDDAEDFTRILFQMYQAYAQNRGWQVRITDANENTMGGYRSIAIHVTGRGAYGALKNESGVHRLVRMSPFNAKGKRNTSFSMVEVLPEFATSDFTIPESELDMSFARSGGAGGQNVNKRETAVRIVHIPTGLSVHATTERSQEANRDYGMSLLRAKVWKKYDEDERLRQRGMAISATTDNEWGSQIRSYVLHPYKMIKDHRTGVETSNVEKVMEQGELNAFIDAEKDL